MLKVKKNGDVIITIPGEFDVENDIIRALGAIDVEVEKMNEPTAKFNHNDCDNRMIVMVFEVDGSQVFFTIEEVEG